MPKIKKTTQSSKRYTFQSFRERVDSIKIEPSRKLQRRAFDEVETSHFLSSLERWREFNRSAVFTNFADEVEDISASLPQILHYKDTIFGKLIESITKQDPISLQPLLELLTQFCHDLGPDFMDYYVKSIKVISELALGENDANTLEWEFNCLAFIFKYLSKFLAQDLIPTFDLLEPLLKSKDHIARFSAEALSFLIRKSSQDELKTFTSFAFSKLDDDQYRKSVVILFSEALKSTQGAIHSKSTIIIETLLSKISTDESSSALADIILNVVGFGSIESVGDLYLLIINEIQSILSKDRKFLKHFLKVLIALIFADSGRKVPDWKIITEAISSIIKELEVEHLDLESKELIVYTIALFTRNCEIQTLTKFHTQLYRYALSLGSLFLPLTITILDLTKERALKFTNQFVQEFLNKHYKGSEQSIAYFIEDLANRGSISLKEDNTKLRVTIPSTLTRELTEELQTFEISQSEDLYEIHWRLLIIAYASTSIEEQFLLGLFKKVDTFGDSSFKLTVLAKIISLLVLNKSQNVFELIISSFDRLHDQLEFITASTIYFKEYKIATLDFEGYIKTISNNLSLADRSLRYQSLQFIETVSKDESLSYIASQSALIEQVPLTPDNSRDIGVRVRSLGIYVKNLDTRDDLNSEVFFKFLFGLLAVKFSPAWAAVWEVLPTTFFKNEDLVWELAFDLIRNDKKQDEFYDFTTGDLIETGLVWNILETRLQTVVSASSKTISNYLNSQDSLTSLTGHKHKVESNTGVIHINAIKALKTVPSIAEKHSDELVTLILNTTDDEDDFEEVESGIHNLNRKERCGVIEVLSTFKKLSSIPKAKVLKERLLTLLSSRTPEIRKTALDCLLNFNLKHVNKYRDNLSNLLDDSLFRDEITKVFSKTDGIIEDKDEAAVMPFILRILFGRAQNNNTSGGKKGLKSASIAVLSSLKPEYIENFLQIVCERIYGDEDEVLDFNAVELNNISASTLRRCLGYTNLLVDIIKTLGEKFKNCLVRVISPLLLTLVYSQKVISDGADDKQLVSLAKMTRQSGMKDLLLLFEHLHDHSWDDYLEIIYEKILSPRFVNFEDENLQQASSLLKLIYSWTEYKSYHELLLINEREPALKVLTLMSNKNTKSDVLLTVIDFCKNIITSVSKKSKFLKLHEDVAQHAFDSLQLILSETSEEAINSKAIDLLLALVEHKHVQDQARRSVLVDLSTQLLEKPGSQLSKISKLQVLQTLKTLIQEFEGDFVGIQHLYEVSSRYLKLFTDRQQRDVLIDLFREIGKKFEGYTKVSTLVEELNSFSRRNISEFDYDRRLTAYREINENLYQNFSNLEWLPLVNNSFFFINDENDLSIRTNAAFTLKRFVDSFSQKTEADKDMIHSFKDLFLPNLRVGLRSKIEVVQTEYIALLSHIVSEVRFVESFDDMKIILFDGDEEANFFLNINHIQLHRRQRAIKRLAEMAPKISGSNIAHYLLPIIENYAYCSDEKLRNISNEAVSTIEFLIGCVSYRQYLAIFKRYQAGLKEGSDKLRDSVNLIVTISKALLKNVRHDENHEVSMDGLPQDTETFDSQLEKEMINPISKILNKRNDETIVIRTPLIEALACLILCLSHDRVVSILPGILTNICQIMRSRSDELRDSTRKYLGKASNILGAKYIKFIIAELKTALARGFQIHVLGFTVNSVLLSTELKHGDLDESASIIMEIVMENLFGSTGQEKEAEGYRTSMKEVKNNKSNDTAEFLGKNISLSHFNDIIRPFKLLLQERITFKVQHKLDELLRRISLGVYKNEELKTQEMLVLCYELFKEAERDFESEYKHKKAEVKESDKHFLVQLSAKTQRVETENSIYVDTFQKFGLELLRTTLNKNNEFLTEEKLTGFLPYLATALKSDNETVMIGILKVLSLMINIEFRNVDVDIFTTCVRRCLNVIKNFPSTESELCQACFKFLSTIIRQKEDLKIKENALGYLLIRIQPDLQEQSRQGLAFNFVKALVSKKILIPEVYDTMDKIREVMVTSHSKERRDMSRSIYFQFIMEYDQGRGRLEKQFKFLVDNLGYPAETGKQSVMELIHLILNKSGPQLLEALSSSFFVALAKVLISDTSTKSREMSIALITTIFEKLGTDKYEKYISGWLNAKNSSLLKCSLQLYRIKLKVSGLTNDELDNEVLANIKSILKSSRADSEIEISWDLIYIGLNCLSILADVKVELFDDDLKQDIIGCLLYPHSWIRTSSGKLISSLLSNKSVIFNDAEIQNIASRLLHQLRAPSIESSLGSQIVKTLTLCFMRWEKNKTFFDKNVKSKEEDEVSEDEDETNENELISDWCIKKISGIVRSERIFTASKKSGIQFVAMVIQILETSRVESLSEELVLPLYNLTESDNYNEDESKKELENLSLECMKMIEEKIGVTKYTQAYSKVRQFVLNRRQDRRTKRARLAISAPDVVARRKIKKHVRTREKRKHEKDENGLYHTKKKQSLRR